MSDGAEVQAYDATHRRPPRLDNTTGPSVGDTMTTVSPMWWCRKPVQDDQTGERYDCSRVHGHNEHTHPHTAVDITTTPGLHDYYSGKVIAIGGVPHVDPSAVLLESATEANRRATEANRRADEAQETIQRIRKYVIEKMHEGAICRKGTSEFLAHFDLEPIPRTFEARFVVSVRGDHGNEQEFADWAETELSRALRNMTGVIIEHAYTEDVTDD